LKIALALMVNLFHGTEAKKKDCFASEAELYQTDHEYIPFNFVPNCHARSTHLSCQRLTGGPMMVSRALCQVASSASDSFGNFDMPPRNGSNVG
jgi:hypothetical protein